MRRTSDLIACLRQATNAQRCLPARNENCFGADACRTMRQASSQAPQRRQEDGILGSGSSSCTKRLLRGRRGAHPPSTPRRTLPSKIFFQSLGCARNLVDTEVMLGLTTTATNSLEEKDSKGEEQEERPPFQVTDEPETADVLVLNTCGFLEAAREESRQEVQHLLQSKKKKAQLIVTGCMVNLHKDELMKQYPQIDAVLGAGQVDQILNTIMQNRCSTNETTTVPSSSEMSEDDVVRLDHWEPNASSKKSEWKDVKKPAKRSYLDDGISSTPRRLSTPPHYAFVKIAEGCRKQCSFCIIPRIKGPLRSKPVEQVAEECHAILSSSPSCKELILIAQDLGDYGKDRKEADGLVRLLKSILDRVEDNDDVWLRLLYLYPDEITPTLIDLMEQEPKRICRYLDMPIQHINNSILKRMRRKTTGDDIKATIRTLRERLGSDIHIRTSLMVGFPGETEDMFQELVEFVRDYQLDHVGVFMYSHEPLAPSANVASELLVDEETKERRYEELMQAQLEVVEQRNRRERVGQVYDVVMEGMAPFLPMDALDEGDEQERIVPVGRYFGQSPEVDGQVYVEMDETAMMETGKELHLGERYRVKIHDVREHDLIGRLVQ